MFLKNSKGRIFGRGIVWLALLTPHLAFAQPQQPTTREIVAEDFTKNRPKSPTSVTSAEPSSRERNQKPARKKRVYRLAASQPDSKAPQTKSSSLKDPTSLPTVEQLGVTIWRLRPARPADTGARAVVATYGRPTEWTPERIEADTPVSFGDTIRLTIESPRAGYLYIIDREVYADGSYGEAMLIFPTLQTRGGDNQVLPGKLIDIPSQEDQPFKATKNREDQVGETLSFIITMEPLGLPLSRSARKIAASELAKWEKEWSAPIERFELVGGAGQTWSKEEKEASARITSRQLTQDEPVPQTIYRVLTKNRNAFMISLRLSYRRDSQ